MKFSHREIPVMKTGVPAMRTGVPCNENRFFPVWKTSQGKPCFDPVLALYRIAVYFKKISRMFYFHTYFPRKEVKDRMHKKKRVHNKDIVYRKKVGHSKVKVI